LNPWLETLGVVLIALSGVFLGRLFSRLGKFYWTLGYFLPLLLIAILVTIRYAGSLVFSPAFFWIGAGRAKYVIYCLAVTIGLTTPLSRLPRRIEKIAICIMMAVVVVWFSVLPFLVPALIKDHLTNLDTNMGLDGICYQSTDYTCAPAAAVTALGRLGLSGEEGELAVLAHTSPVAGTLPACLQSALESRYGRDGLRCHYRYFNSLDELRNAGITLAVIRDAFLSDHCVVVLDVSDDLVTIADPAAGKLTISHERFEQIWRHTGIVLERETALSI